MMQSPVRAADDRCAPRHRLRRWEARSVFVAAAVSIVHVLDDHVFRPPAGVERAASPALALVALTTAVVLASRRLRPAVVAPALALVGAIVLADGGTHVVQLVGADGGAAGGTDVTGALVVPAGAVLLLLALLGAFRRQRSDRSAWWRWCDRVATLAAAAALTVYLLVPAAVGMVQVHLPGRASAPPPTLAFSPVTLHAADGPDLLAWYHPSRNGAAVMVLNSARGDHGGSAGHARLLAEHGYGVLTYDARGTGGSEGAPNGWGWTWLPDVKAGIDFLERQSELVPEAIGLLGLSTGADVAIQAAAQDARIGAVVADGATSQSFADRPAGVESALSSWPMFTMSQLAGGAHPLPPLDEAIVQLGSRPVLLIAGGSIPQEITLNERYLAAADSAELWASPDVSHTSGLASQPEQYAKRVLRHFDAALLPNE